MWNEDAFRARVTARCEELGRSKRQTLVTAGLAHDFLQTEPAHGRRVDNLEKLAAALDWNLADILGVNTGIDEGVALEIAFAATIALESQKTMSSNALAHLIRYHCRMGAVIARILGPHDQDPPQGFTTERTPNGHDDRG